MRVTFGLPYDGGYWQMLASGDRAKRAAFLDRVGTEGVAFLEAARHSNHPAFAGYYIPYEIDQYSWADPADRDLLAGYLRRISTAARGPGVLSISTFRSGIPTTATLEGLWERILTSVPLKVMVQDGVGVFGMANYDRLAPLFATLRRRGADFDVIVELFTEKPSGRTDGTTFAADPATIGRLQAQLAVAAGTGARRLIGFRRPSLYDRRYAWRGRPAAQLSAGAVRGRMKYGRSGSQATCELQALSPHPALLTPRPWRCILA